MYEEQLTFGGIPKAQALHWDTKTRQVLGNIVYLLTSGTPHNRKKAQSEWFILKRQFMLAEWDEYLDRIDAYRENLGAPTLRSMIAEVCNELRESYPNYMPLEHKPVSSSISPDGEPVQLIPIPITPTVTGTLVAVEQLSLF